MHSLKFNFLLAKEQRQDNKKKQMDMGTRMSLDEFEGSHLVLEDDYISEVTQATTSTLPTSVATATPFKKRRRAKKVYTKKRLQPPRACKVVRRTTKQILDKVPAHFKGWYTLVMPARTRHDRIPKKMCTPRLNALPCNPTLQHTFEDCSLWCKCCWPMQAELYQAYEEFEEAVSESLSVQERLESGIDGNDSTVRSSLRREVQELAESTKLKLKLLDHVYAKNLDTVIGVKFFCEDSERLALYAILSEFNFLKNMDAKYLSKYRDAYHEYQSDMAQLLPRLSVILAHLRNYALTVNTETNRVQQLLLHEMFQTVSTGHQHPLQRGDKANESLFAFFKTRMLNAMINQFQQLLTVYERNFNFLITADAFLEADVSKMYLGVLFLAAYFEYLAEQAVPSNPYAKGFKWGGLNDEGCDSPLSFIREHMRRHPDFTPDIDGYRAGDCHTIGPIDPFY